MKETGKCKSCKYWKNYQAEMGYAKYYGFCVCYKWKFRTDGGAEVMVFDRMNITEKYAGVNRFESVNIDVPMGEPQKSRYCFVTEEGFGCTHYKKAP